MVVGNILILYLTVNLASYFSVIAGECVDSKPNVCRPMMWPPWWGIHGPLPCDERRYEIKLYRGCRKTCNFCTPCDSNICQNGGTCVKQAYKQKCVCPKEFTGNRCQTQHTCSVAGYTPEYYLNLCYKLYDGPGDLKTYPEAQATCKSDGGQLVAIKGYHTYDLFRSILKKDKFVRGSPSTGYWTDGKKEGGTWHFSNGKNFFMFYSGIDPERRQQKPPVCLSLFWDNRLTGQVERSCETTSLHFICSMPTTQS